jgi:hypothetical protein
MPAHLRTFWEQGNDTTGVFFIPQNLHVGTAIEEIVLIWLASTASDWQNRLIWLPLRPSPDVKSFHSNLRRFFHYYSPDLGVRRTHTQFAFEILEIVRGAHRQYLYTPVIQVLGPTQETEISRRPLREVTIAYPLHFTGNVISSSRMRRHKP